MAVRQVESANVKRYSAADAARLVGVDRREVQRLLAGLKPYSDSPQEPRKSRAMDFHGLVHLHVLYRLMRSGLTLDRVREESEALLATIQARSSSVRSQTHRFKPNQALDTGVLIEVDLTPSFAAASVFVFGAPSAPQMSLPLMGALEGS